MVTSVSFFENAGLSSPCERAKTEVFEYDDVIHHTAHALWGILSYFHLFLAFWCCWLKAIQVKHTTCGLVFSWKQGEKIFLVEKKRGIRVHVRPNKEIDNFARVAHILVHFSAVTARLLRKVTRLRLTNWSRRRVIEYFGCHRLRG